jgi:hypothetical protein
MNKYGFVYIWFDCKHKRYYVGSHWGHENDPYVCSSTWMRNSYRRRPEHFKRRIIAKIYTSKYDMFVEEDRYLRMIKKEELGNRYYNLSNYVLHWIKYPEKSEKTQNKMKLTQFKKNHIPWNLGISSISEEGKANISKANTGNKYRVGVKASEETRAKISLANKRRIGPN